MRSKPSRKCAQGNWHLARIVGENGQCLYRQHGLICEPRWVLARCRGGSLHPSQSIDSDGKCAMCLRSKYAGWMTCKTPLDTEFIARTFRISNRAVNNPRILNNAEVSSHLTDFFDGLTNLSNVATTRFGGRVDSSDAILDAPLSHLTQLCVEINVLVNELVTGCESDAPGFEAPDLTIPIIDVLSEPDESTTFRKYESSEVKSQLILRGIEHSECGLKRESPFWLCPLASVFELIQPTESKKVQRHLFTSGTSRSHPMLEHLLDDDSLTSELNSMECPMRDVFQKWQRNERGIRRYRKDVERRRLLSGLRRNDSSDAQKERGSDTPLTDLSTNPNHTEAFGISEDDWPEGGAYYYDAADRREEADFRDDQ